MAAITDSSNTNKLQHTAPCSAKWWTWRRLLWLWSAAGIGLPLLWLTWGVIGWPGSIEWSRETTWLPERGGEPGYEAYVAYVADRHRELGGGSIAGDTWISLELEERSPGVIAQSGIFYSDPLARFHQSVKNEFETIGHNRAWDFGHEVLPRLRRVPWTAEQFPVVAQTLSDNQKWYDFVADTFMPVSPIAPPVSVGDPINEGVSSTVLPATFGNRLFSDRFLLRSAFRFGENESLAALQDIRFVYRIAARDSLFAIEMLVGASIEAKASRNAIIGLLSAESLSPAEIEIVASLPQGSLKPRLLAALEIERLQCLDLLMRMHDTGLASDILFNFSVNSQPNRLLLERRFCNSIDWNAMLRYENECADKLVSASEQLEWHEGFEVFEEVCNPPGVSTALTRITTAQLWNRNPQTTDAKLGLSQLHAFRNRAYVEAAKCQLRRNVVQLAVRMAVWKQKYGTFPETLSVLKDLQEFSSWGDDLTRDPLTGKPLKYVVSNDGFEIHSAGIDGNAMSHGYLELNEAVSEPHASTDSDDLIWRWPLDE